MIHDAALLSLIFAFVLSLYYNIIARPPLECFLVISETRKKMSRFLLRLT